MGVILPPAGSPTASFTFSPTAPATGASVFFDGSASQPGTNASIASYVWTFGDGASTSGVAPAHRFENPGTYVVTLTVTNDRGLSSSASQAVAISSGRPSATFTFTVDNPTDTIAVDAGGSTAVNGTITSYAWNWGDGSSTAASGASATTHHYTSGVPGTFSVTLTVVDSNGQTAQTTRNVTVN
jgi:PKD repeat protein